ncbi:hypothetical protein ILYODFUR_023557, partial [Ilyodon furcidens]
IRSVSSPEHTSRCLAASCPSVLLCRHTAAAPCLRAGKGCSHGQHPSSRRERSGQRPCLSDSQEAVGPQVTKEQKPKTSGLPKAKQRTTTDGN